ncbi:MAG TPA: tetratricopeptide repeat protein [Ignavibacteria bacterium]|nr:tetratricopeptide repeat protein [Ignavibacteria bacterium]
MYPTGKVTFLFTDIEGSTKLSQEYPESLQSALEKHYAVMHKAVESNNGFVFEIVGDAFCCAFEKAEDAVKAAVDAQIELGKIKWKDAEIKIRIGIHSGNAEWINDKYMGYITLARTARVMSSGYGEQILISDSTYELCRDKFDAVKEKNIVFRDLGERRLKDVIQPIRLFQIVSEGLREEFPSLKTLDARPNNLPVQLTSFIGREKDISAIKEILKSTRLLTLTGPGGTGKTRLSLQVAAEQIDEFNNGVWLVEFASLRDPVLVAVAIAGALGVAGQPGEETMDSLQNFLKKKEMLIVMDNCEHLIDACADIAEKMLKNSPGLKIIATSREGLRSSGESIYRVLSLDHPDPESVNSPVELSQYEAVRLFIERAIAVNPEFRVTNQNAPSLAQICYQLDGIPLAIELAAARIKILSVEKILEKLNDRFRLLTGGKRTALPRQQTLRALIDWSYDLLSEKEKILLQRLSVFSGGWNLTAAETICPADGMECYDVLDTHSNLSDKSLISTTEISGSIRFYMLQTIRQYAMEKLEYDDELKRNHFHYFMNTADQAQMHIKGLDQTGWLKSVDADSDNIRSAIQWSMDKYPDEGCMLISKMIDYWDIKGYFREAYQTSINMIVTGGIKEKLPRANVLYCAGLMAQNMGMVSEAEKLTGESLSIFRECNDRTGIGKCVSILGVASSTDPGRGNETRAYYDEAISIFKDSDLKRDYAVSLYNMSYIYMIEGDQEKALQYRMEALNIYKGLNDNHQIALIMSSLGVFELRRKNYDKATSYTEESLAISNENGDKYLITINLINLGNIYIAQKEYDKAMSLLKDSILILKEYGYQSNMIVALMFLGEAALMTGDYEKSINCFKESLSICNDTGNTYYQASNLFGLGSAYFELKDFETSLKYLATLKKLTDGRFDPISNEKKETAAELRNKIKEIIGDKRYMECVNEDSVES